MSTEIVAFVFGVIVGSSCERSLRWLLKIIVRGLAASPLPSTDLVSKPFDDEEAQIRKNAELLLPTLYAQFNGNLARLRAVHPVYNRYSDEQLDEIIRRSTRQLPG
jgi:hypothetical protein